jgi:hypothetical protein
MFVIATTLLFVYNSFCWLLCIIFNASYCGFIFPVCFFLILWSLFLNALLNLMMINLFPWWALLWSQPVSGIYMHPCGYDFLNKLNSTNGRSLWKFLLHVWWICPLDLICK